MELQDLKMDGRFMFFIFCNITNFLQNIVFNFTTDYVVWLTSVLALRLIISKLCWPNIAW